MIGWDRYYGSTVIGSRCCGDPALVAKLNKKNLLRDSKRYWKIIRVIRECQLDLQLWLDFLPNWNGVYFFDLPQWAPLADFELSSDASGKQGFGVYNNGAWFCRAWLPIQQPLGMAYKELFPIVLACHIWGQSWANKRIKF